MSAPATPEERGRYILDAIHAERERVFAKTGDRQDRLCRLTKDQFHCMFRALTRDDERHTPFTVELFGDRTDPIEGVELEPYPAGASGPEE